MPSAAPAPLTDRALEGLAILKRQKEMKSFSMAELATIAGENHRDPARFVEFCAARFEISERGFMCPSCSAHHYLQTVRSSPCGMCKGKPPLERVIVPARYLSCSTP
jgi:hypothetical protein